MYNSNGIVIFTTGISIENKRNHIDYQLVEFELSGSERIIAIQSHDKGDGNARHYNV